MAIISKGTFSLDLFFLKLETELSEEDRQCAWEFYVELSTRVAVVGKLGDKEAANFDGELWSESMESLYAFFKECRLIMRRFPVGRIKDPRQEHLGRFIHRILENVVRPFLEKWNARFRPWWAKASRGEGSPYELQAGFPERQEFLADWTALRLIMRAASRSLAEQYQLMKLD